MRSNYQLRLYPDSVLRRKSLPVNDVDGMVRELMDGMAEIMYTYNGIGLAAPQVGVLQRVIIADVGEGLITLANPEILQKEGEGRLEEGCLSLPEIQVNIARSQSIFVRGINPEGKEVQHELNGLIARVVQHEIDHLNGVLIIDYASATEKIMLRKKLKELQKQYEAH
ncbi:MAG: peptide deformylase [candidate division KSB1 bacterium]|nr:peptide deformylase [candidate division KSB1 bacterium]MDZ7304063.1 peptide deformylase [candidate division KSB1 bacterium]MDZ7313226.1 peptide deformylase [candidate division KSB1 bacterium]